MLCWFSGQGSFQQMVFICYESFWAEQVAYQIIWGLILSSRNRNELAETLELLKAQIDPALLKPNNAQQENSSRESPSIEDDDTKKGEEASTQGFLPSFLKFSMLYYGSVKNSQLPEGYCVRAGLLKENQLTEPVSVQSKSTKSWNQPG